MSLTHQAVVSCAAPELLPEQCRRHNVSATQVDVGPEGIPVFAFEGTEGDLMSFLMDEEVFAMSETEAAEWVEESDDY